MKAVQLKGSEGWRTIGSEKEAKPADWLKQILRSPVGSEHVIQKFRTETYRVIEIDDAVPFADSEVTIHTRLENGKVIDLRHCKVFYGGGVIHAASPADAQRIAETIKELKAA